MTLQAINVGTVANDRTGDTWRAAMVKVNANTVETQAHLDAGGLTFISRESDFDVQDATTITLETQKVYVITAAFTTTKNFIVQEGVVWTSFNQTGPLVTYSGSGTMFSGTDANFTIYKCIISCPLATVFSFTGTVVNTKAFLLDEVSVVSCNKIGTFTNLANALFIVGQFFSASDGITYAGTGLIAATVEQVLFVSTSVSFIGVDLGTATINNIELDNLIVVAPSGAIGVSGLTASANVPAGFLGMLANSSFSGGITTPISGITTTDFRWTFLGNTGIADTIQDALLSFNGSSTETTISTQDVPVIVNATWTQVLASIFTTTTAGRATSDSERDLNGVPIDVAVGLLSAGGSAIDVTVYLAKNGSVITASATSIAISGTNQAFISIPWQDTISEDDFYEIFVENNTNTTNIIVESGKLRIR